MRIGGFTVADSGIRVNAAYITNGAYCHASCLPSKLLREPASAESSDEAARQSDQAFCGWEEIDPALDALSLFCNDVLFCRIRYPSADNRIGSPPGCGDGGRRENYPSYVEISPENKESGPIRVLLASLFGRSGGTWNTLPNAIPGSAYQRVGDHTSHAVSEHKVTLAGRVAIRGIERLRIVSRISLDGAHSREQEFPWIVNYRILELYAASDPGRFGLRQFVDQTDNDNKASASLPDDLSVSRKSPP